MPIRVYKFVYADDIQHLKEVCQENISYKEMAVRLKVSENTIKSAVKRLGIPHKDMRANNHYQQWNKHLPRVREAPSLGGIDGMSYKDHLNKKGIRLIHGPGGYYGVKVSDKRV